MFKKVFGCLIAVLVVLCFSLSTSYAWYINSGDAVYRDLDTIMIPVRLIGHAGLYIGGNQVVHMQKPRCEQADFSNFFNKRFWGSFCAGNYFVAKNRVQEANRILSKKAKYDFYSYKSFGDNNPVGRCDGMVEYCYEKFGTDVANDYHWSALTPQMQWKSTKTITNDITSRGLEARREPLIDIGSWFD